MLTLRDPQSGDLFDPWEYLGPQRRKLLEQSWAGVFRDYLLQHLPVKELAVSFRDDFGRPVNLLQYLDGRTGEAIRLKFPGVDPCRDALTQLGVWSVNVQIRSLAPASCAAQRHRPSPRRRRPRAVDFAAQE